MGLGKTLSVGRLFYNYRVSEAASMGIDENRIDC